MSFQNLPPVERQSPHLENVSGRLRASTTSVKSSKTCVFIFVLCVIVETETEQVKLELMDVEQQLI